MALAEHKVLEQIADYLETGNPPADMDPINAEINRKFSKVEQDFIYRFLEEPNRPNSKAGQYATNLREAIDYIQAGNYNPDEDASFVLREALLTAAEQHHGKPLPTGHVDIGDPTAGKKVAINQKLLEDLLDGTQGGTFFKKVTMTASIDDTGGCTGVSVTRRDGQKLSTAEKRDAAQKAVIAYMRLQGSFSFDIDTKKAPLPISGKDVDYIAAAYSFCQKEGIDCELSPPHTEASLAQHLQDNSDLKAEGDSFLKQGAITLENDDWGTYYGNFKVDDCTSAIAVTGNPKAELAEQMKSSLAIEGDEEKLDADSDNKNKNRPG